MPGFSPVSYLSFKNLSYGNNPNKIILHHPEVSHCSIYDIHQWHLNNGWAGCGYHFFVDKQGNIYRGRPEEAIGSHCPKQNAQSIGICAEGEYMSETMPDAQKKAIVELIAYLKSKYGIDTVAGHRDYYNTDCPGTNYPMNEIVNETLKDAEEEKKVKNIVVYSNEVDKRAAEYLADYLQCPIISNSTPFDYLQVENVFTVGAGEFTSYTKQNIKGADRYETIKAVLKFIAK